MVAAIIQGVALNNGVPVGGMRPRETNCVAMAFSKVLGIGVHATVNLFVARGYVPNGDALEHDGAILRICAALGLTEVTRDETWLSLKARLGNLEAGRYFACNSKAKKMLDKNSVGHAFAIIRHGSKGWGVAANNAEEADTSYVSKLLDADNISLWGPA